VGELRFYVVHAAIIRASQVPAEWPWVTFAPVFVVWILAYIVVWLGRWIVAPVASPNRKGNE
jgi:hypothetical protein